MERMVRVDGAVVVGWMGPVKAVAVRVRRDERTRDFMMGNGNFVGRRQEVV